MYISDFTERYICKFVVAFTTQSSNNFAQNKVRQKILFCFRILRYDVTRYCLLSIHPVKEINYFSRKQFVSRIND